MSSELGTNTAVKAGFGRDLSHSNYKSLLSCPPPSGQRTVEWYLAVPKRARIQGSQIVVPINSRLESDTEERRPREGSWLGVRPGEACTGTACIPTSPVSCLCLTLSLSLSLSLFISVSVCLALSLSLALSGSLCRCLCLSLDRMRVRPGVRPGGGVHRHSLHTPSTINH